jgi:hypothetical protein
MAVKWQCGAAATVVARSLDWAQRIQAANWIVALLVAGLGALWMTTRGWVDSWSTLQQALFYSLAFGLLSIVSALAFGAVRREVSAFWRWAFRHTPWADNTDGRTDRPGHDVGWSREPADPPFHRHSLTAELHSIDLMHVGDPEAHIVFGVRVRNYSGARVQVDGFAGEIRIAGQTCNAQPVLVKSPLLLPRPVEDGRVAEIRQPISAETANMLAAGATSRLWATDSYVPVDLSSLRFVGTYEATSGGAKPIPNDVFLFECRGGIKGPVRNDIDAQAMFKARTLFVSQEWYDVDSLDRRKD